MSCRSVLLTRFKAACEELLKHTDISSASEPFILVADELDEQTNQPSARLLQQDGDEDVVNSLFVQVYDRVVDHSPTKSMSEKARLMVALSQIAKCLALKGTELFRNAPFCFEVMKLAAAAARECGSLNLWADSQTALSVAFRLLEFLEGSQWSSPDELAGHIRRLCGSIYSLQILVSYQTRRYEHVLTILRTMDKTYSASSWKMAYVTCYNIGSQYVREKSYTEAINWLNLCFQTEAHAGREVTKDIRNRTIATLSSALLKLDPKAHWPRAFQLLDEAGPSAETLKLKLCVLLYAKQKDETLVSCLLLYLDILVTSTSCVDVFRREFLQIFSVLLQHKRYAAALAALDQRGWLREDRRWVSPQSEPLKKSVRWIGANVAIKCCLNLDQERDVFNILQEMITWEKASQKDIPVISEAISVAEDVFAPWMDRGYYEQSLDWYKTLIELSLKQGLSKELGTIVRNAVICAIRSARPDKLSSSQQLLSLVDSKDDVDLLCLHLQIGILTEDQAAVMGSFQQLGKELQKGMDKKVAVVDGLCKCVRTAADLHKTDATVKLFQYAAAHAVTCSEMALELVRIELRLNYELFLKTGSKDDTSGQRLLNHMLASLDLVIDLIGSTTVFDPDEELAELIYDRALGFATLAWNVASRAGLSKRTRHAFYLRAYRLFSAAGYGRFAVEKTSHCAVLVAHTGLQAAAAEAKDMSIELYDGCLKTLDGFERYKVVFQHRRSDKTITIDGAVIRLLYFYQILLLAKREEFAQVRSLITSCRRQMQAGLIQPDPAILEDLSRVLFQLKQLPDHQELGLQFLQDALYSCISSDVPDCRNIDRLLHKIVSKSISLTSAGANDSRQALALLEKILRKMTTSRTPEMFQFEISWIAGILASLEAPVRGKHQRETNGWINLLQEFSVSFPDFVFLAKLLADISST